jgi:Uma2 family endonuclease
MSAPAVVSKQPKIARNLKAVVIGDEVVIPGWVVDLESFNQWCRSEEFPEKVRICYLAGEIWVDLSMEQIFSHNQVKTKFIMTLGTLVESAQLGYFFADGQHLSHPDADLSAQPDGIFASWDSVRSGRVRLIEGATGGYVDLEGTPDMVLEIVSPKSVRKDTAVLRDLYWRAGIPEYWLVDARGESPRFDIFRRTARGYVASRRQDGWLKSAVFGRAFQLTRQTDPLGHPLYTLAIRSEGVKG